MGDHKWHSDLLSVKDMCEDPRTCALGIFAPSVLFARNAKQITDGRTTFTTAALAHLAMGGCCCWCICVPFFASSFREYLRRKRNLPPDPCSDVQVHMFCHPCAICQEGRELDYWAPSQMSVSVPDEPTIDRSVTDTMKHLDDVRSQTMEGSEPDEPKEPDEPTIDRGVEDTIKHLDDVRTQTMER